ncbi:MAG TPA: aminoacyl-tRNA hydrolase [Spirochaetia bacterium]|nr:aminoacyl-tRNA hydrolase [Spirochaetia bacterium]
MSIRLVVFLGNPGTEYRSTRHNAGWMLLGRLPGVDSVAWQKKFKGTIGELSVPTESGARKILLLRPETYMNLSGESVQPALAYYKIDPRETVVVHDEIELPFGMVSIRLGGGLGGHNGLRSIAALLGTNDFGRLRIGVGRPEHGSVSSYVLGRFAPDEEPQLDRLFAGSADILLEVFRGASVPARARTSQLL